MKKLIRIIFLILIIILSVFIYTGYSKYKSALDEISLTDKVAGIKDQESYTEFSDIPDIFIDAAVAVEDRRFYDHNGFDIIGIGRAFISNLKNKELVEGGSTITQQLAKNLYFPLDRSPSRKIAEVFMALKLENEYSKDEILELYFNVIYYGKGCYNIRDAADKYFDKKPIDMTDYEATLLAGIPNAPSVYSTNKELASQRQEKVLRSMVQAGYISEYKMNKILDEN